MPLVPCPSCGNEVSDQAAACPQCGHPLKSSVGVQTGPTSPPKKSMSTGCIVGLVLLAMVPVFVAVIGILAAIAIPNFLKFQARARQSEAKANLKGIYVANRAHYAETGVGAQTFEEMGFELEPGHRYTYFYAESVIGTEPLPQSVATFSNPQTGEFQAVAVGNIDGDPTLDVWVINAESELSNLSDDVRN